MRAGAWVGSKMLSGGGLVDAIMVKCNGLQEEDDQSCKAALAEYHASFILIPLYCTGTVQIYGYEYTTPE